jgi:hypothetical protein
LSGGPLADKAKLAWTDHIFGGVSEPVNGPDKTAHHHISAHLVRVHICASEPLTVAGIFQLA